MGTVFCGCHYSKQAKEPRVCVLWIVCLVPSSTARMSGSCLLQSIVESQELPLARHSRAQEWTAVSAAGSCDVLHLENQQWNGQEGSSCWPVFHTGGE